DILGVCEVENKYCLEQLIANLNGLLVERDYGIVHADATLDRRGIDTAFIYDKHKFSFDPDTLFSYFVMRRTGTRDITQVTFTTASGNELVALCNHWPSRSGGAYESQGYRMTAGETLSYWHQRIWEIKGNDIPIIAMGDLNDDPFDLSVQVHARATRERGDVERTRSAPRFYNLAWNYLEQEVTDRKGRPKTINGTLYWSGNGNLFDQILVSKGLVQDDGPLKVLADSAQIEAYPEMTDHRVSYGPIRFGLPKGDVEKYINKDGFSDHYPVSVLVEETVPEN
ncbi:MAG: endonuclease/exonuclease/phosphatase family protein, partial [Chloroflexota bacterium]